MGEELFQADLVPSETDYKNFVDFGNIPGMTQRLHKIQNNKIGDKIEGKIVILQNRNGFRS